MPTKRSVFEAIGARPGVKLLIVEKGHFEAIAVLGLPASRRRIVKNGSPHGLEAGVVGHAREATLHGPAKLSHKLVRIRSLS